MTADEAREEADAFGDDLADAVGRVRALMVAIPRSWGSDDTAMLLKALTALADGEAPPWRK